MKYLWVKYLSLILILAQTSVLFADTITFNNGQKINGKLISISEEHELDPKTGVTSEVTFKVDEYQLKMISEELIVGKVDNSTLMFDKKSIYKITDDKGNVIFSTNKNLINTINNKELSKNIFGWYFKCREGIPPELCDKLQPVLKTLSFGLILGFCLPLFFAYLSFFIP
jgi:hypothetical protein